MVITIMELKEAILQTLAEIDTDLQDSKDGKLERDALLEVLSPQEDNKEQDKQESRILDSHKRKIEKLELKSTEELKELLIKYYCDEEKFLNALQERILVLFEGLQSPNNRDIENKVYMILNFLEFTLAIIDEKKNI